MWRQGQRRDGVILSGGGAYAAYEVGVMKALFRGLSPAIGGRPVTPQVVAGTSAGAFNATLLADRFERGAPAAVEEMERVWLEKVANDAARCANGVYRWRANLLNFFDLRCFLADPARFVAERLEDTLFLARSAVERTAAFFASSAAIEVRFLELLDLSNAISTAPFPLLIDGVIDFGRVRSSALAVQVTATNWRTGALRLFTNQDMTDAAGSLIVRASSAIPGIFPPVDIPPDVFIDGGVLLNTPLAPAIAAGATDLYVIYLDPDISRIPIADLATTVGTLQRTFAISWAARVNEDIAHATRINRGLAVLAKLAQEGVAEAEAEPRLRELTEVVATIRARRAAGRPLRPLVIHRFHPPELLGDAFGMLDFDRRMLERLIEQGYRDALAHDCSTEQCVSAEGLAA